ncbi:Gfo/Idh/MocA family protein [Enterobacter sp. ENT03]|uniref:Gfo/Idh/MocA family protein n=1 Tax=Enterobacter sp. ENT03 TaxID=2854780 RepID=UPI001C46812D|nr:Gfo/Idh/MocA family oxidoreductase [Enterobacter sp. ENT03]MBV7406038.1 Gfo/Idh/MocA family oxidoreductase [Enterobacter sp. ENT03]
MDGLNVAIIGAGAIHGCHRAALQHTPGVRLRALVDIDAEKGAALAHRYGCCFYTDYREMLLDTRIDAVHICTPHHLHREMIIQALAAGKHVFSEKPPGLSLADVALIREAATAARGLLGVCFQNRYNPTSQAILRQLASGAIGTLRGMKASLTWSRGENYYTPGGWRGRFATEGGSLLINQAIHTLDLMQWFAGGVTRLKGVVDSTLLHGLIETEDSAMATLEFTGGAHGVFHATTCYSRDAALALEIDGEKACLRLEENQLWRITDKDRLLLATDRPPSGDGKGYWGDGHGRAIQQFYATIRDPAHPAHVSLDEAARSQALVDAIYRSSQIRQWISLAN